MLKMLFKTTTVDDTAEIEELNQATRALNLRMNHMLEQETLRKIRFGTVQNTPVYYR